MRPEQTVRIAAATVLAAGFLGYGAVGPATACACGGIVSSDLDARVTGEQALIAMNGGTETIVMRLDVHSVASRAALIVPTPAPATASQADAAVFPQLERLTAPRVEANRNARTDLDAVASAPGGVPTVLARVQLGPLEATTLAGGDLAGVRQWLYRNGYVMRPEVTAQLDPYLRQGWSFVAMRLTGAEPLRGQLDPVRLDFASDRFVYPMRMSAAAKDTQRVVTYTLSEHRMQRTDNDAAHQAVAVDYAGPVAGRATDPTLIELSAHNPYLTRISTTIDDPAAITADFTFGPAPSDAPYQQVIRHAGPADVRSPLPAIGVAVALVTAIVLGSTISVLRHLRPR